MLIVIDDDSLLADDGEKLVFRLGHKYFLVRKKKKRGGRSHGLGKHLVFDFGGNDKPLHTAPSSSMFTYKGDTRVVYKDAIRCAYCCAPRFCALVNKHSFFHVFSP